MTEEEAAIAHKPYAKEFLGQPDVAIAGLETLEVASPAKTSGSWKDLGGRWWRCPQGHSTRAPKNATSVCCDICGATRNLS